MLNHGTIVYNSTETDCNGRKYYQANSRGFIVLKKKKLLKIFVTEAEYLKTVSNT